MFWDHRWKMKEKFVIMGFWIQGFRCFPWMAVLFFLKDGLDVDPRTLQILQNFYALPVVAKPLYGIVSDSFYICGQRRIPYISIGVFLQAFSWLALASLPRGGISIFRVSCCLVLSNFGAAIVEVANDAIVTEMGKRAESARDGLWSHAWTATAVGGMLGNLAGVVCIDRLPPQSIFLSFSLLLVLQFSAALLLTDASLDLPAERSPAGARSRLSETGAALKKPEILFPMLWLLASFGAVPATAGVMFFYQTRHLRIGSSISGLSKSFGQAALLSWSVMYDRHLKFLSPRRVIVLLQILTAVFVLSDLLFIAEIYTGLGVPDRLYVVFFSGVSEVLFLFKILPFSVAVGELCPPGLEGSVMAILMSVVAAGLVIGGCFGVALASFLGLGVDDYTGLSLALLVQASLTLVPVFYSSWIPHGAKSKGD